MNQIKAQIQRERDTEKVSERGVLGSMGMRMGRERQREGGRDLSGVSVSFLPSSFLPISSYDDLAHSSM